MIRTEKQGLLRVSDGIIDYVPMPIAIVDRNLNFMRVNQTFAKIYGNEASDFSYENIFELFYTEKENKIFHRLITIGEPVPLKVKQIQFQDNSKNQSSEWNWSLNPVKNSEGVVSHLVLTIQDVSSQIKPDKNLNQYKHAVDTIHRTISPNSKILNQLPFGLISVDKKKKIRWMNDTAAKLLNLSSKDEIYGQICHMLICPEEVGKCPITDLGLTMDYSEKKLLCPNGKHIPILKTVIPVKLEDEEVLLEAFLDITKRKKTETQLEFLSSITQQILDAIIVTNNKFEITYVNHAVEELYGFSKEELIGKSPDILNAEPIAEEIQQEIYETVALGNCWTGVHLNRRKDGTTFIAEHKVSPLVDKTGQKYAYLGVSRDITARKEAEWQLQESEEKYRDLIETMSEGLAVQDSNGIVTYVNQALCKMLGYTKNEIIGQHYRELLDERGRRKLEKQLKNRKRGETNSYDIRIPKKDGNYLYAQLSGKPIFDENKNYCGSLAILTDITERKRIEKIQQNYTRDLEREVKKKTEKLLQAEKLASIGLLAAGIAHEINNPIMGIMNYAQIIKNELKSFKKFDFKTKPFVFLDNIIKEGERIAKIATELLLFARNDSGDFKTCHILEPINFALNLLRINLNVAEIKLNLFVEEGLPEIPMRSRSIQQVILNAIQNSIDAINEKFERGEHDEKKIIDINVSMDIKNSRKYLKIEIQDTGQGIKKENLKKLFDPFFTTKRKTHQMGTGLGLSVSYGIIEEHGGFIQVESEWGQGTSITIFLPYQR